MWKSSANANLQYLTYINLHINLIKKIQIGCVKYKMLWLKQNKKKRRKPHKTKVIKKALQEVFFFPPKKILWIPHCAVSCRVLFCSVPLVQKLHSHISPLIPRWRAACIPKVSHHLVFPGQPVWVTYLHWTEHAIPQWRRLPEKNSIKSKFYRVRSGHPGLNRAFKQSEH